MNRTKICSHFCNIPVHIFFYRFSLLLQSILGPFGAFPFFSREKKEQFSWILCNRECRHDEYFVHDDLELFSILPILSRIEISNKFIAIQYRSKKSVKIMLSSYFYCMDRIGNRHKFIPHMIQQIQKFEYERNMNFCVKTINWKMYIFIERTMRTEESVE